MNAALSQLGSGLLLMLAGGCLWLYVVNHLVLQQGKGKQRIGIGLLLFLILVPAEAWYGYRTGWSAGSIVALAVLAALALEEAWQMAVRRRLRGEGPQSVRRLHLAGGRIVSTTDLVVSTYAVELPAWRGPSFRVAHLSDLHLNRRTPRRHFEQALRAASEARPDLLFLTGDFVSRARGLPLLGEVMPLGRARCGIYAVLGNHDYEVGRERVAEGLRALGVAVLGNSHRRVALPGGAEVLVSGCEDPWAPGAWAPPAERRGEPLLVLAHTADNVYRLSRGGATAVFSGHYHAGQVRVPLWGAVIIPSLYGRRFEHGHFVVEGTHLFVSAGVGASEPHLRVFARPDLFVIDFQPGAGAPGSGNGAD